MNTARFGGSVDKKQFDNPTLLLVEHGETDFAGDDDTSERIHGTKYDLPLTVKGHQSAQQSADKLKGHDIASLKTSPMQRAKETAERISDTIGMPVEEDEGLTPLDAGYLSGMTHEVAKARIEYYVQHPDKPIPEGQPYGEWWDGATSRMEKRLKEAEKTPGRAHVDVLHSSEIASMPLIIKGEPPQIWSKQIPGPGNISAVKKVGGKWNFIPNWEGEG